MNAETIANLILAFCFGITIAIFITPIFVYLKKIMYHQTQNKKWLDKAIEDGHIITAKKIKEHGLYRNFHGQRVLSHRSMATYQYTYNGKTYKKQFISHNNFNSEMTLYFIKNPRKAAVSRELWVTAKNHWIRSFFIVTLICTIISWFILFFK